MIASLYDYFDQAWAYALFHDRFPLLEELNNKIMLMQDDSYDTFVNEIAKKIVNNNWRRVSVSRFMSLTPRSFHLKFLVIRKPKNIYC